jgi:hypothetical protein
VPRGVFDRTNSDYLRRVSESNKRAKGTPEARAAASLRQSGEGNSNWKGESATYNSIHRWLQNNFPKMGVCAWCEHQGRTAFALLHGRQYTRVRSDYVELCYTCHNRYDT